MNLEFNRNEDVLKQSLGEMRRRLEKIYEGGGKKAIEKQREKEKEIEKQKDRELKEREQREWEIQIEMNRQKEQQEKEELAKIDFFDNNFSFENTNSIDTYASLINIFSLIF